ncbi:hypothetical protein [Acinetobacter oleivorans]|uniref:hypothetical protein n=1 Tax=Acinetobacter oleivorans TaxID=1148157 RepID=UPI00125EB7C6|nr:hypothetical protein [Acinetobacter oleivorans]
MSAIQYIQKFHITNARKVVEGSPDRTASHYVVDTDTYYSEDFLTYFDHSLDDWETADLNSIDELETIYELVIDLRILKRLVESLDYVNKWGGLQIINWTKSFDDQDLSEEGLKMKQAVRDYESIYGEGVSNTKSEISEYPCLECPLCERLSAPRVVIDKNQAVKYVAYKCPPDHINHGDYYKWKIMPNGELVD